MPTPLCIVESPLPAIVIRPSTKSVGSAGTGGGFQRSWLGEVGTSSNGVLRSSFFSSGWYGLCTTDGRMRYAHVRRFCKRGAVNGVPLNCSVYKPSGAFCGEFCPFGSAPRSASLANSLPKPLMYFRSGCFAM